MKQAHFICIIEHILWPLKYDPNTNGKEEWYQQKQNSHLNRER